MRSLSLCLILLLVSFSIPSYADNDESRLEALKAMADGDTSRAISLLGRETDPRNPLAIDALLYQARAWSLARQFQKAQEVYDLVLRLRPSPNQMRKAQMGLAECFASKGQFSQAERLLFDALQTLTSPLRKQELAKRYIRLGEEKLKAQGDQPADPAKAEILFRQALQIGLSDDLVEQVTIQISKCLYRQKRYGEAAAELVRWSGQHPRPDRRAEILFQTARALWKAKDPAGSRRYIRELLADLPQSAYAAKAAFLLSRTYGMPKPADGQNLALGQEALRGFIQKYPKDPRIEKARLELALAPYGLGRQADAEDSIREYLRAGGPEELQAEARYHLGLCLAAQKRFSPAADAWREYLKFHPTHAYWSQARRGIEDMAWKDADSFFIEKKWKQAAAGFLAFAEQSPASDQAPEALLKASLALLEIKEVDLAFSSLTTLTSKFPNTPAGNDGWFELARLLEDKRFDFVKAREAYRKVQQGKHAAEAAGRLAALDQPSLHLDAPRQFFSGEKPSLVWFTRNIESVTVRAYRLQAEDFFRDRLGMNDLTQVDIALCTPDRTWTVPVAAYQKFARLRQEVPLPFEQPGLYLLNLSAGKLEATTAVLVSDLGIVLKTTPEQVFVFAQDRKRLRPLAQAKIIVANSRQVLFEGTTDAQGIYSHSIKSEEASEELRLYASFERHLAWTGSQILERSTTETTTKRAFLFSDRPAYRPGDAVHLAGIVRDNMGQRPAFSTGVPFDITVNAPNNIVLWERKTPLDEFGVFHEIFQLDPAAAPGHYSFSIKGKNFVSAGSFQVANFRRLPFQLSANFEHPVVFQGELLAGTIQVRHQHGAPAGDQLVQYRLIQEAPFAKNSMYYDEHGNVSFGNAKNKNEYWQEGKTDAQGQLRFSFPTRGMEETAMLKLEFRLPRHSQSAEASALLAVAEFSAQLHVEQKTLFAGQPFDLSIKITGPDGKPRGATLILEALQRTEGSGERRLLRQEVVVPDAGVVQLPLNLPSSGEAMLRVLGWDRDRHPVTQETLIHLVGKEDPGLFLDVDRATFTVGDKAKVVVHNRADPALVLLTYETDRILRHQSFLAQKGDNSLELPIDEILAPNFQLAATAMNQDQLLLAGRSIKVSRQLNLKLRLDQEHYGPGEEATLTLIAQDLAGRPLDARVVVSVVDAALLQLFPENLGDLVEIFHEQRPEGVVETVASCTQKFPEVDAVEVTQAEVEETEGSAGMAAIKEKRRAVTEKGAATFRDMTVGESIGMGGLGSVGYGAGGGGLGARGRASGKYGIQTGAASVAGGMDRWYRQYFQETAAFFADIRTGADGVASVTFRLPDTITTWKVVGRGVTRDTQVGEARMDLVIQRPFWVDLLMAPELDEADQVQPMARVFNESPTPRSVQLKFGAFNRQESRALELGPHQTADVSFSTLEIPDGSAGQTVSMDLEALGGDEQDRIKRQWIVQPRGIREEKTTSGLLETTAQRTMEVDAGWRNPRLQIQLTSQLIAFLVGTGFDPLLFGDRPEEALVALQLLDLLGPKPNPAMRDLVLARLHRALVHMLVVQQEDGGWGYCRSSTYSSLMVTASAVKALALARPLGGQLGWPFPQAAFDRAVAYLNEGLTRLNPEDWIQRATVLYALAHVGQENVPQVQLQRMHRLRDTLPLGAQALLGLTWIKLDRPEQALEVARALQSKVSFGPLAFGRFSFAVRFSTDWIDRLRSLALLAQTMPQDLLVNRGADWLWDQGAWVGWRFPGEAEAAYQAFSHIIKAKHFGERMRIRVLVNGQDAGTIDLAPGHDQAALEVPAKLLQPGKMSVELRGEGTGPCYFTASLSGHRRDAPAASAEAPVKITRHVELQPPWYKGREIKAGFSVMQPGFGTWSNDVRSLPAGQRALVTLEIRRKSLEPLSNFVLEERIPAGFEVVEGSVSGGESHSLRQGRRLAIYLPEAASPQRIQYELVAVFPGSYQFPPMQLLSMSDPSVNAIGEALAIGIDVPQTPAKTARPTPDELYLLGKAAVEEKDSSLAISSLEQLLLQPNLQERITNEILSLLLFAAIDTKDNPRILKYFELVKEKDPSLIIPFEKIPPIQLAYRELQAFEGAYHLGRGVADATFMSEVRGVGVLEDNGEVAEALALFRNLLSEYPDTAITAKARYAFAQAIYDRSDRIATGETIPGFDRKGLLHEVVLLMGDFLARFPSDPEAPAAVFSTASALLENDRAPQSVAWSDVGLRQHAKSDLAPAIAYLKAFAHFKLGQYDRSLELCRQVAEQSAQAESRDMANYITAQIYHAQGDLKRAIETYRLVEQRFRDASETISELEREHFEIPEVVSPSSAERPVLEMKLKNIERVDLRAYQVDLMKLYLLKGSLRQLNEVNLAGIKPVFSRTLRYDKSRALGLRTEKVPLDLPTKGAYLVLARAGSSLTHSLVLVGHLDCEVTEVTGEGRVRVTVRDEKGKPVGGARVELKGSSNDRFTAGSTDLRGIFLADGVLGEATVIANHRGLFGLYRGTKILNQRTPPRPSPVGIDGVNRQDTTYDFEDSVVQGELKNERKAAAKDFFKQAQDTKGLAVEQAK